MAAAAVAGRFLEALVERTKSVDLSTFVLSLALILLIASISIWAGTRRIAALNITEILRVE